MEKPSRISWRDSRLKLDAGLWRKLHEKSKNERRLLNSSGKTLSARYRNPSERPQIRDHLRNNDGNMLGRLGHRRQSAFERLSDTYSPSTTKSGPNRDTLEMVPIIEVVLTNGTLLLTETVLEAETALTASKNRM
nr:hypothetical protein [Tanacetum cinerariifolium]